MREGVARLRTALSCAVYQGQTKWSVEFLRAQEPRFTQVWSVTSQIPGWFGEPTAAAMFLILAETRPRHVVEIGSYLGRSTVFFASALHDLGIDGTVTAIDPHTGDRQQLEALGVTELSSLEMFRRHLLVAGVSEYVQPIVSSSHEAAQSWTGPVDFLFVDGWHSYDAVMEDALDWMPHLSEGGVVVFDDAIRYDDVSKAIDDLVAQGHIHLWGDAFGQAFAGRSAVPPRSVSTVLGCYRPLTRRIPGKASVRRSSSASKGGVAAFTS